MTYSARGVMALPARCPSIVHIKIGEIRLDTRYDARKRVAGSLPKKGKARA